MIEDKILEEIKNELFNGKANILNTGFKDLDTILSGVKSGSLITIGSRPAMGKTSFALSVMNNLLQQNKNCLYFSLDMCNTQVIKRLISQIGKIPAVLLNNPDLLQQTHLDRIDEAIEILKNFNLTLIDTNLSVQEIGKEINEHSPEYVFIDYLQLIHSKSKNRMEEIGNILRELRIIAKENNCIIFILSQLSRAIEGRIDKRPMLSDLRESGSIEDMSDVVMFVYRDDYYNTDSEDYAINKGSADIIVAKNKTGTCNYVKLLFNKEIVKFVEPIKTNDSF